MAKTAGAPPEQVQRFIDSAYIPYPWQWYFHASARLADLPDGPVDIGAGGARGPGKSHCILSQVALDDCQRVDRLKCLFLRQTGTAAKESFDDLIEKTVQGHIPYERVGNMLKVGKGSRIILGGFKDAKDIDKYVGIEYDIIIVEELNQLTEEKYTKLRGSLRTSKPGWRPRMYTSFNPGGQGHEFVKKRYVIPFRKNEQVATRFIGSTYKNNPNLNKEYIDYLEGLQGDLGRAWREGDWDLFSGQVFSEFSYLKHVIRPIIPAKAHDHYLSFDWGYSEKSKFACYLSAVVKMKTEDGQNFQRIITYKEWAGNQKSPHEWASIIYRDCQAMGITPTRGIGDSSMFNPQSDGGRSISDLMRDKWRELHKDHWTIMEPGTKNRLGRVATVHNWLSIGPDDLPYWMITETCPYLIESLPALIYDELKVDDVNCFVAGTKIKTQSGWSNVEDIRNGDLVWTPIGYREAYAVGVPKITPVVKVQLSDGRSLEGTAYHKVMVAGRGLVELQMLNCDDILVEWNTKEVKSVSRLFTGASSIENITVENILNLMGRMFPEVTPPSIVKFGSTIMALFLWACMCIIKITMRSTMISQILSLWRKGNMHYYTTERELLQASSPTFLGRGVKRLKAKAHSGRMLIKCVLELLSGNYRALIVASILKREVKHRSFVQNTRNMVGTSSNHAQFVDPAFGKKMVRNKEKHVRISAVGCSDVKEVYQLSVRQAHLYCANGFVVTNTKLDDHGYDSISYFLYRVPFMSVKKGPISYKAGPELKRVEWSKDGKQQIALDIKEFENQYD